MDKTVLHVLKHAKRENGTLLGKVSLEVRARSLEVQLGFEFKCEQTAIALIIDLKTAWRSGYYWRKNVYS